MGRHTKSVLEELVELPWWVSIVMAAFVFALLRWLVPAVTATTNVAGKIVHDTAFMVAPYAAFLFLIPAPLSILRSALRGELLTRTRSANDVTAIPWHQFEALVATAFQRIGYRVEERGGWGPDGGVDMVLHEETKKTLVQCKHWRRRQVGVDVVRELCGVMTIERADAGIIITGGSFTAEARALAAQTGIELVNGEKLQTLLSYARGEAKADSTSDSTAAPICPNCAASMVLRTARRGANSGNQFWGCSRYPGCKGTRPLEPV